MNLKALILKAFARANLELRRTGGYRLHLYNAADRAERPFYNIGAGSFFHPCWTNIDFVSDWYSGVQRNVVHHDRPGTFESTCHRPQSSAPLEERWLHHVASQLAPNDISPSEHKFEAAQIREILNRLSMEEALDYFTSLCRFQPERPGNHISWWNRAKVERFLRDAGFTTIYRSGYMQSRCPLMRQSSQFDSTHPQMSVYVEAIR